ncbi:MAG: [protein-PII] uridylyltransferase [Nitrospirota bacterium]
MKKSAEFQSKSKIILNEMRDLFGQGYGGIFLVERYTDRIDSLIIDIYNSLKKDANIVLIATGGYGRKELAPFSDIDIMFFASDRIGTEDAEQLLYKLWDTGLTISHSFRTGDECIEESLKDIRTRTSLLEARYIAGNKHLYNIFRKKVYTEIAHKRQKNFVREKLKEMEKRHAESGDSVFLLEPNIKEGEGGLRDVHTAYWLSKVALKIETIKDFSGLVNSYDYKRFLSAYDFLLRTRFCLHLETKRKNDVLTFEYQKNVASELGFKDSKKFRASERFMRYYYLKGKIIKDTTRKIVGKCSSPYITFFHKDMISRSINADFSVSGGRLITKKDDLFEKNPDKIMESYHLFAKTGRKFSEMMKENIRSNLLRINRRTRKSLIAVHYFLEIFKSVRVYETLREMHETGVLGRFVPEFGALRLLVVHEPYHMYTVDEHTLLAIRNLENLRTTKYKSLEYMKMIINEMEHIDNIFMALLFHDIGKAAGRRHEEEGYKRLKNILERFNLDSKQRSRIEFLVRNHILMSNIALKRETSDAEVIARFADAVEDLENLKAIYLITYSDMSAVNPGFLTSWKSYLLNDLFERTKDYLTGVKEDRAEYIRSLQRISPGTLADDIGNFLEEMPERYMLSTTKARVLEDYKLVAEMKKNRFAMRIDRSSEEVVDLVISAEDRPGLFSIIVGFLSSRGFDIVNGRIFTGKNGIVIDKISISNWKNIWWEGIEDELEKGLKDIIIDRRPVKIISRSRKAGSLFDIFIELDNEASDDYSLIEIFSPDRIGLLYDISNVMYEKGLNIVNARINTEAGLAQDIFYVLSGKEKLNNIAAQELLSDLWTILKE